MNFDQAMIAKLTVKKVFSILDHMQIVLAHSMGDQAVKLTMQDWIEETRLHLRKIEFSVEAAAK